jgi:hypothetical protein
VNLLASAQAGYACRWAKPFSGSGQEVDFAGMALQEHLGDAGGCSRD